jgi:talin
LVDDAKTRRYGLWLLNPSEEHAFNMHLSDDFFPLDLPGSWLDDKKTLDDLLIHDDYTLLFRNKIDKLSIKTLDETEKTRNVDFSKEVKKVVKDICDKEGIQNPTEYLFCIDDVQINELKKRMNEADMSTLKSMNLTMNSTMNSTMRSNQTMNRSRLESTMSRSGFQDGAAHKKDKETIVKKSKNKLKKMADRNYTKLQQKLITDDKIEWLHPSETLASELYRYRDLGINYEILGIKLDLPTVVLRRRYFFSDANVEERDPKQLALLYKQCVKSVITGEYSVTKQKALQLAGFQAKAEYGRYSSSNKPDKKIVAELIPADIIKKEKAAKLLPEIVREWEDEDGVDKSEGADFKFKWQKQYIKVCRSMPTYGVTCFLVKAELQIY